MEYTDRNKDKAETLLHRAIKLYDQFNINESAALLTQLLEHRDGEIEPGIVHEYLGFCHYYLSSYDQAVQHLEKALSRIKSEGMHNLHLLMTLIYLGETFRQLNLLDRSMDYFQQAEEHLDLLREPKRYLDLYLFHLGKGRCHFFRREYSQALSEFSQCHEMIRLMGPDNDPQMSRNIVNFELARTHFWMSEWDNASDNIEKVDSSLLPETHSLTYQRISIVLKAWDDMNLEAVSDFEQSGESVMDDNFGPLMGYYIGRAYYMLGQHGKARTLLEKGLTYRDAPRWVVDKINECLGDLNKIN